jgi:hypothetical protein
MQDLKEAEFIPLGIPKSKFMCYKGFYGLNCMAQVDAWGKFNMFEIRWPAGTNDIIAYTQSVYYLCLISKLPIKYYLALDEAFKSIDDGKHITPFSGGEIQEAETSGNHVIYFI